MFDLPPDIPADHPQHQCIRKAAVDNRLPEEILWAIRIAEGGKRGILRQNKDGSVDVGVMQINSTHFDYFRSKYGVKPAWLLHNQCISILAGGYRLAKEIKRRGDFWIGVGDYHSRTQSKNLKYRKRVLEVLERHNYSIESMRREARQRFGD
ncbi:conjugal transfer protein [Candidatus Saccharibacteria bacterium]|nr:conjugal transfer protein [Candidatus Saccharibacteria bacterium]|tara:strand:- start:2920 stop:3375 length:456 start_codon:yes stop_codon:yes gene_type:complete